MDVVSRQREGPVKRPGAAYADLRPYKRSDREAVVLITEGSRKGAYMLK